MPKILLARGARGELVRKIQVALTEQGIDPQGTDAKFGKATEAAVKLFQQTSSLEPTGRVDAGTWTALLSIPVPNTQERALQLTAAFEGHGFSLAQGNWDGAGITWGIIGFTPLGLTSELGRALAFDIHVQNGGVKPSAREEIEAALDETTVTTELELRVIIAHAVTDASSSFKEEVRARKLTIATGAGKVHGETFVLSNWGLDESTAGPG